MLRLPVLNFHPDRVKLTVAFVIRSGESYTNLCTPNSLATSKCSETNVTDQPNETFWTCMSHLASSSTDPCCFMCTEEDLPRVTRAGARRLEMFPAARATPSEPRQSKLLTK